MVSLREVNPMDRRMTQFLVAADARARFTGLEPLARGGMGAVFVAWDTELARPVVLKIQHEELASVPSVAERFEREAAVLARLGGRCSPELIAWGSWSAATRFVAMEWIDGKTLTEVLKARPTPIAATELLTSLLRALAICHAAGVVHRDLKPDNILIEAGTGRVRLVDFGLAKIDASRDASWVEEWRTAADVVLGSVRYMAPEAVQGMEAVGERADLYAVGVIAYSLCAGRLPFEGATPAETFRMHRFEPPPPFDDWDGDPDRLAMETLALRLLAKSPADRPASANATIASLERLRAGFEDTPRSLARVSVDFVRWQRASWVAIATMGVVAATIVGALLT